MTSRELIGQVLANPEVSTADKWVIQWQFGLLGGFESALAKAISAADERNLERLNEGFPTQVSAYLAWQRGDMAKRLRKMGLDL